MRVPSRGVVPADGLATGRHRPSGPFPCAPADTCFVRRRATLPAACGAGSARRPRSWLGGCEPALAALFCPLPAAPRALHDRLRLSRRESGRAGVRCPRGAAPVPLCLPFFFSRGELLRFPRYRRSACRNGAPLPRPPRRSAVAGSSRPQAELGGAVGGPTGGRGAGQGAAGAPVHCPPRHVPDRLGRGVAAAPGPGVVLHRGGGQGAVRRRPHVRLRPSIRSSFPAAANTSTNSHLLPLRISTSCGFFYIYDKCCYLMQPHVTGSTYNQASG